MSLVFGNFYFNYYSYKFGLGLWLELGFRAGVRFYYEMSARMERAPRRFFFYFMISQLEIKRPIFTVNHSSNILFTQPV